MQTRRRYWAMRTSKPNSELLFGEVVAGRARQGWGYHPDQDLRAILKVKESGRKWRSMLTDSQLRALPNFKMLGVGEDSIHVGDVLLLPNLPRQNFFCLAEVTGEYFFDLLDLGPEDDINQLKRDFGHVLPVRLLTPDGINKYNKNVHASLRSTLRTPMRMWNIDEYAEHMESLLGRSAAAEDLSALAEGPERLKFAWENALIQAKERLRASLSDELDAQFQAAEWENPIQIALKALYPGSATEWTAGPQEVGADIVLEIPDHFGQGTPWIIVIQVKNYRGAIGTKVLEQIRDAYHHYGTNGQVIRCVIVTTAERSVEGFDDAKQALEEELEVPVHLMLREETIGFLADGLSLEMLRAEWRAGLPYE